MRKGTSHVSTKRTLKCNQCGVYVIENDFNVTTHNCIWCDLDNAIQIAKETYIKKFLEEECINLHGSKISDTALHKSWREYWYQQTNLPKSFCPYIRHELVLLGYRFTIRGRSHYWQHITLKPKMEMVTME